MSEDSHFDVVVVGSGFGGSVMAYRLAERGKRVCLLERGKAYAPHEFPRSPAGLQRNFWDPSEGLQGMFDVWSFEHISALIASGLGGGSLIYANVLLRKDEKWFVESLPNGDEEPWPVTRAELDPHYDAVERMLSPQRYPLEHPLYANTKKTLAFKHAAEHNGLDWMLPPLAVTFANAGRPPVPGEPIDEEYPNLHGRKRLTCTLCGECDIGCNVGAKNTLDHTYLSHALRLGADIRTLAEVRTFAPQQGGGYHVDYVVHDRAREGSKTDTTALRLHRITCDRLVLAAGTLGTTYLLLRNLGAFPGVNRDVLGTRFSGNGDLLTLAWRATQSENGRRVPRVLEASRGPVITSAIRMADQLDGGTGRGFYIEDAGYPEFVNWMVQLGEAPRGVGRALAFVSKWIALRLGLRSDTDLSAEISELFGDCSPSVNSLPMLGMGRDVPNGRLSLAENGDLRANWKLDLQTEFFTRMRRTMAEVADGMGAEFEDALSLLLDRVITVHPLGGCPMANDPLRGVVDPWGQVYGHEGLFIADGSVMPGAVGANPSLTIAALANRFADRLLEG